MGFGYGAYAQDCIRNEQYPFMYESTLPALAMKIGIVGLVLWMTFILGVTVWAWFGLGKPCFTDFFWWLGLAFSYALAVQTFAVHHSGFFNFALPFGCDPDKKKCQELTYGCSFDVHLQWCGIFEGTNQ